MTTNLIDLPARKPAPTELSPLKDTQEPTGDGQEKDTQSFDQSRERQTPGPKSMGIQKALRYRDAYSLDSSDAKLLCHDGSSEKGEMDWSPIDERYYN